MKDIIITKESGGLLTIDGVTCTFGTKDIRSEIESISETNKTFNLPSRYTYEIKPSYFWGKVAKIIFKKAS